MNTTEMELQNLENLAPRSSSRGGVATRLQRPTTVHNPLNNKKSSLSLNGNGMAGSKSQPIRNVLEEKTMNSDSMPPPQIRARSAIPSVPRTAPIKGRSIKAISNNTSYHETLQIDQDKSEESYFQSEVRRLRTEEASWKFEREKLLDQISQLSSNRDKFLEREDQLRKEKYEVESSLQKELLSNKDLYHNSIVELQAEYNSTLSIAIEKERSRAQESLLQQQAQHQSTVNSLREQLENEKNLKITSIEQKFLHEKDMIKYEFEKQNQQLVHELEKKDNELKQAEFESTRVLQEKIQQSALVFNQEKQNLQVQMESLQSTYNQEKQNLLSQIGSLQNQVKADSVRLETQNHEIESLKQSLSQATSNCQTQQTIEKSHQARIYELENRFSEMKLLLESSEQQRDIAKQKLLKEEMIRRKLHNQIQELKGNIRVYCRIRPPLESEKLKSSVAKMSFPDQDLEGQQLLLTGPASESAIGSVTTKTHPFEFDKVFSPSSTNEEVFDEVSELVQSALDGYNVCIFAYGQTGSGKTHTMSSNNGIIPKAVNKIFETSESLKERGWKYEITGEFLEIYNETMRDLLGSSDPELDGGRNSKLEIHHDSKLQKTTVTNITTVHLDSPSTVYSVLKKAASNRSVAATSANERSSRSHSVFILRINGENTTTGKICEGTLNLIDLAGSERLAHSQATGIRLKETQSINKSLSYLGDVICALGDEDKSHIPYRNSKLTYLLQYSLSGNSKTLMFVNISPLEPHVSESISSLRFATKVNNTKIN